MVIGIDIRMLARGAMSGVEEYTINLLENMLGLDKSVKFKLFYNGYKKVKIDYDFLRLPDVELKEFKIPNRILNTSLYFFDYPKMDELLNGVNIFFSPHIFLSAVSKKCKTVITFHDISFKKYPEFYSASKNYWHFSMNPERQAHRADKIIAVSQSTKDDLVQLYNTNPEKIKVIYSGINKISEHEVQDLKLKEIRKKYNLPEKYILCLGTLEPRKNIIGLIKAFELLNFKRRQYSQESYKKNNIKLVIAGSKGWKYNNIFKTAKKSLFQKDIIFTGFVADKDKPILYKQADLFVYPSFYEGFGFPPLEAMAAGIPVITSNFSSLPEAVSDAAITINPYNIDELYKAIEMVLNDDRLKNILVKKGSEQVEKFSWQKCAEETLEFILK